MPHKISQFLALETSERWMFLKVVGMLPFTTLGLRLFGVNRCYAGLKRLAKRRSYDVILPEESANYAQRIRLLMRLVRQHAPYRGTCLSRSLSLWWLLRRQGIESQLRIGVRKNEGRFEAHAWLEYQGYPLNAGGKVHQRFVAFEEAIVPLGEPV